MQDAVKKRKEIKKKKCADCEIVRPYYLFSQKQFFKPQGGVCNNCNPTPLKKSNKKKRICLKCDRSFLSHNNRICYFCKLSSDFQHEAYEISAPLKNHLF